MNGPLRSYQRTVDVLSLRVTETSHSSHRRRVIRTSSHGSERDTRQIKTTTHSLPIVGFAKACYGRHLFKGTLFSRRGLMTTSRAQVLSMMVLLVVSLGLFAPSARAQGL